MNNIIGVRSQESGVRSQESGVRSQESGVRPVVSFCIPSYNKAEVIDKIVKGLLISEDQRFEVIVNDNASDDNTIELLSKIHDPRVKFYRNDTNVGGKKNWCLSLERGTGEYLYLVMGRDKLHGENIPSLIETLHKADADGVSYMKENMYYRYKVYDGIDAMIQFVKGSHPTGLIIKGDVFKSNPEHMHLFEKADMDPMGLVACAALQQGKGATINCGVWQGESLIDFNKVRSTNTSDPYYLPERSIKIFYELIEEFFDLPAKFSEAEKNRYFKVKFEALLYQVSTYYKWLTGDTTSQLHYGQTARHVGFSEMLRNIRAAYTDAKAFIISKGIYTFRRQMIMYAAVVKASGAIFIRAVLEPMGILERVRKFKRLFKLYH